MVHNLLLFLSGFLLVYLLIPLTKKWALAKNIVDRPNRRKIHHSPIPLSGGIAIYGGFFFTLLLFGEWNSLSPVILGGGLLLLIIGVVDDWYKGRGRDFPASLKLLVQISAAIFVYLAGIRLEGISNFLGLDGFNTPFISFPEWLSLLTTILWIVGMINMINFLDGVDGLAGGVTVIAGVTLFLISFIKGQGEAATMAAVIVGGSLAFLRYNFYPATIFLGDAGSMFLGYALAVISLFGAVKSATLLSVAVTALALGVPVLDTLQVILTRFKQGVPLFRPDRQHVHHRLLKMGLNQKQTVYVLYFVSLVFSLLSLWLLFSMF